jgi:hypothetical protein
MSGFRPDDEIDTAFVDDVGLDFHLTALSPCLTLAHDLVLPFDIEGTARAAGNASGVYVYNNQTFQSEVYYRRIMQ